MIDRQGGPARVVIDGRIVGPVPNGISRYVTLLARGLASIRDASETGLPYEPVFLTRRDRWPGFEDAFSGFATRRVSAPFLSPREVLEIPAAIRAIRMMGGVRARTIYHSPSFSSLVSCPVPWLVTVHDLIHLRYGNAPKRLYYRALVRPFLRGATERMTVSEASRREISRWAGVPADSITIVRTAIDPSLTTPMSPEEIRSSLMELGLEPRGYFFCLSSGKPHKNVALLVSAYRKYRNEVGENSALPLVTNVSGFEELAGVRRMGDPSQLDVRALLAGATAFLFPSRHEGFGLPPLEAAVLGTPVVVSRIPPLEEALQSFGPQEVCWVDPADADAWTEALRRAARGELPRPGPEGRTRALDDFSTLRLGTTMDRIYHRGLGLLPSSVRLPTRGGIGGRFDEGA